MFERNDHAVVVGYCICAVLCDLAEARVGTGRYRRASAQHCGQRSKSIGIDARVRCILVNSVMSEVADAHRSVSAKTLLPLQAPPLKFGRVNCPFRGVDGRRSKTWNA